MNDTYIMIDFTKAEKKAQNKNRKTSVEYRLVLLMLLITDKVSHIKRLKFHPAKNTIPRKIIQVWSLKLKAKQA